MTPTTSDDAGPTLGEVLRHGRTCAGVSVRALSEQAGVSVGQLSKLENDQVQKPNPAHLAAIAGPLAVPISKLYEAAGYTIGELAAHDSELVDRLKQLSPEALDSVIWMVDHYLATGNSSRDGPLLVAAEAESPRDDRPLDDNE